MYVIAVVVIAPHVVYFLNLRDVLINLEILVSKVGNSSPIYFHHSECWCYVSARNIAQQINVQHGKRHFANHVGFYNFLNEAVCCLLTSMYMLPYHFMFYVVSVVKHALDTLKTILLYLRQN